MALIKYLYYPEARVVPNKGKVSCSKPRNSQFFYVLSVEKKKGRFLHAKNRFLFRPLDYVGSL